MLNELLFSEYIDHAMSSQIAARLRVTTPVSLHLDFILLGVVNII